MTVDTPRFDLHEPLSGRWRYQPGQVLVLDATTVLRVAKINRERITLEPLRPTEREQIAAIVAAQEA